MVRCRVLTCLLLPALALASPGGEADDPPVVRPTAWIRAGYQRIDDDGRVATTQDGFVAEARIGAEMAIVQLPVTGHIELALLPDARLADAYVTAAPTRWLSLRIGQFKQPFSIHTLASDTHRLLPGSPRIVDAAGIRREIGAAADVSIPFARATRAVFTTAAFNGEGPNRIQNVNDHLMFTQRLLITPLGVRRSAFEGTGRELYVGIGGGWIYTLDGTGLTSLEANTFGAEAQLAWHELSLQAEWIDGDVYHANPSVADYLLRGGYAQLGCFIPAKWARDHVELVVRVEQTEPNTIFGAAEGESLAEFQRTRITTIGANLYARRLPGGRFHDFKVQLAWEHPDALEGDDLADDTVRAIAQARF